MKKYIVFLKQVPLSTKVAIDPVTKTLKRSSALCQTNPDDLYALQAALNLSVQTGAEVIAVSMGPASARAVLYDALQRGAHKAVLLSSGAFAGSDTWCTSLILAEAARKIGHYDMLFFGKMAIDGDTAQVGPEVAAHLNIPQVTAFCHFESVMTESVKVCKKMDQTKQILQIDLPCAVMVGRDASITLQSPTLEGWRRSKQQKIEIWDEMDLGLDTCRVGLMASPTRVVSTHVPTYTKKISWIADGNHFSSVLKMIIKP